MADSTVPGAVVIGVQPGHVRDVMQVAAQVAERFAVPVVCVTVDAGLLALGNRADGSTIIEPLDPDSIDRDPQNLSDPDRAAIDAIAATRSVEVEVLTRVGDPVRALAMVAEERNAVMIVVGTNTGWHRLAELMNGSVAARLTRRQHRPVLVVPTDPVGFDHLAPSDPS
ncbi:universal stress family protein [Rhodococcus sp. 06-1477-1B]|nr:universal stress family protein [Rhodococcus sp. 06-1477-1B]